MSGMKPDLHKNGRAPAILPVTRLPAPPRLAPQSRFLMSTLQTARRYEELLSAPVEPSPYDYATLFQADGWLARRRAKARFQFLKTVDPKLRRILHPDEKVYYLTSGTTATMVEQFFVGWVAQLVNQRALIFTTERVLLLQIDHRKRPRDLVAQLPYTSIADLKSTWDGHCRLRLRNHTTLNFAGVPKADRKFLRGFLADILRDSVPPLPGVPHQGIENLCPHCFQAVAGLPAACPHCRGGFKSTRRAVWLSALFPGMGSLYLGHRGVAAFEILGAAMVWLGMVIVPLLGSLGPDAPAPASDYWFSTAFALAFLHGIDALVTHNFATKGLHPAGASAPVTPASG